MEKLQNKEWEKSFLPEFTQDIAAVRNCTEMKQCILTSLTNTPGIQGVFVQIINPDGQSMSPYVHSGPSDMDEYPEGYIEVLGEKTPLHDGLQNRVLQSYVPLLFHVDMELHRGIKSKYLSFWKKNGHKHISGGALRCGDLDLGILWLLSDDIDLELHKSLCAIIATAMSNLYAFERLKKHTDQQDILLQFTNAVSGVQEKRDLERSINKYLGKKLGTRLTMIHSFDPDGHGLSPFLFDISLCNLANSPILHCLSLKKDRNDPMTVQLMESNGPLVLEVEKALGSIKVGNSDFWEEICGLHAYGSLLKIGQVTIGTLWLLNHNLDIQIFKSISSQISMAMANLLGSGQSAAVTPQENKKLPKDSPHLNQQDPFSEIVGQSKAINRVYHLVSTVAKSNSTVLVLGETGTGKELIAKAIHKASPRIGAPLVKVNCAAMPANLIESELFGHEKGSFTGALDTRIGKFELANHGTLFLDEIGEMPLEAQVKLLRVLQERELERVGGKQTIKVNVRIIAATNRNLAKEVKEGRFRADLFYRLNVFPITLPPLRERMEDLEPLANFFVGKYTKGRERPIVRIAPHALQQLHGHSWPGNIRELEHIIERSVLFSTEAILREVQIQKMKTTGEPLENHLFHMTLEEMERTFIQQVLRRCRGKVSGPGGAAEAIGIPGNTLHSKMKKHDISRFDHAEH